MTRRTSQLTSVTVGHPSRLRQQEIEICLTLQIDSAAQKKLSLTTYDKRKGTEFGISVAYRQLACVTSFRHKRRRARNHH
jgi:hypothetical protein